MQEIGKFESNINVIPNNLEKYMAFFLEENWKFIDSLQFMNDALEKLITKNITVSDMKYTSQEFQDVKLIKRKGIYTYDYMDSYQRFNDKNLSSKEKFFCMLSNEHITDKDYEHAQNVWNTFNLESMGQY